MQGQPLNVEDNSQPPASESCQGCRKRKLKCSRDVPVCTHCQRLTAPCVYDGKRNKPGLKTGAVEALNRRIEALEDVVLRTNSEVHHRESPEAPINGSHGAIPQEIVSTLASLCAELCKFNSRIAVPITTPITVNSGHTLPQHSPSESSLSAPGHDPDRRSQKRRRIDSCGNPNIRLQFSLEEFGDLGTALPPPHIVEQIVNAYFNTFQPWIPILHETHFRKRIDECHHLPDLLVVLHAMVVAAIRFVDPETLSMSQQEIEAAICRSRNLVVINGMDNLSVENLQALIIVAFNDIGNGDQSRAWSIIGSLTRTVEYLQLSVENEHAEEQPVFKPRISLPGAAGWIEEEERRRVFWNIFALDRFCSVLTGWNTSLTAEDVRRRLPADGGLWHKGEPVITPYFGIWTRFEARMGNSIAFLPAHYASPEQTIESAPHGDSPSSNSLNARNTVQVDMSTVGAFAYCIEATESLSQVTSYFLQQKVNFSDRRQVSIWLTRFKELDLRLVHWKMFLPEKWKDSNISRQPTIINMDPNLTLAHLTHNTSMILLHQRIAYPQSEWKNLVQLPSACSAETCQNAAIETQNIAEKYLRHSDGPVNNQFTFCVFIAANVLLVHSRHNHSDLIHEFWSLIDCLDDMACRWTNTSTTNGHKPPSLASIFAARLRSLHQSCNSDPDFQIDLLHYSRTSDRQNNTHPPRATRNPYSLHLNQTTLSSPPSHRDTTAQNKIPHPGWPQTELGSTGKTDYQTSHASNGTGPYSGSLATDNAGEASMPITQVSSTNLPADELSNISYMLLDQSFMDLDRIITLDNMIFSAPMSAHGGMALPTDDASIVENSI